MKWNETIYDVYLVLTTAERRCLIYTTMTMNLNFSVDSINDCDIYFESVIGYKQSS